jgi:hypothetical protein
VKIPAPAGPHFQENTMSDDNLIGYITLRIPLHRVVESESWEMPEQYVYLEPGPAEIVTHDIPLSWHEHLRDEMIECGVDLGTWGPEELAATTTLHEHPLPAGPRLPTLDLFNFQKWAR